MPVPVNMPNSDKIFRDDHRTQRPSADGQADRDFNAVSQPIKAPGHRV